MAITEPICEQIIQRIESRLKLIKTAASAYPLNAEVYRADESGQPMSPENKDFAVTIFVISDDELRDAGDCGKDTRKMMVGYWLNMRHDADGMPVALILHLRRARMHSQHFQAKIRLSLLRSTTKESREHSQLLRLLDAKRISTEQVRAHLHQHGAISRPIQTGSEVLLTTQSVTVRSVFHTFLT